MFLKPTYIYVIQFPSVQKEDNIKDSKQFVPDI